MGCVDPPLLHVYVHVGLQQMTPNRRAMLIGRPLNPQQMVHPHHQPPGAMARTNTCMT